MHNNPILWIMKKTSKRSFEMMLKSRDLDVSTSPLPSLISPSRCILT